jgi:hypothetical protein
MAITPKHLMKALVPLNFVSTPNISRSDSKLIIFLQVHAAFNVILLTLFYSGDGVPVDNCYSYRASVLWRTYGSTTLLFFSSLVCSIVTQIYAYKSQTVRADPELTRKVNCCIRGRLKVTSKLISSFSSARLLRWPQFLAPV